MFGALKSWLGGSARTEAKHRATEHDQKFWSIALGMFTQLGVKRIYCRYDGGHDEGFANVDSAMLKDGRSLSADQFCSELVALGCYRELKEALGFEDAHDEDGNRIGTDMSDLKDALDEWMAIVWAAKLLGRGYGTGEYWLYGAFWADLETGTLTDDPAARVVPGNIQLDTGAS